MAWDLRQIPRGPRGAGSGGGGAGYYLNFLTMRHRQRLGEVEIFRQRFWHAEPKGVFGKMFNY